MELSFGAIGWTLGILLVEFMIVFGLTAFFTVNNYLNEVLAFFTSCFLVTLIVGFYYAVGIDTAGGLIVAGQGGGMLPPGVSAVLPADVRSSMQDTAAMGRYIQGYASYLNVATIIFTSLWMVALIVSWVSPFLGRLAKPDED